MLKENEDRKLRNLLWILAFLPWYFIGMLYNYVGWYKEYMKYQNLMIEQLRLIDAREARKRVMVPKEA